MSAGLPPPNTFLRETLASAARLPPAGSSDLPALSASSVKSPCMAPVCGFCRYPRPRSSITRCPRSLTAALCQTPGYPTIRGLTGPLRVTWRSFSHTMKGSAEGGTPSLACTSTVKERRTKQHRAPHGLKSNARGVRVVSERRLVRAQHAKSAPRPGTAEPWPSSHRLRRRVGSAWRFRPFSAFGRRDSATGRAGLVAELRGNLGLLLEDAPSIGTGRGISSLLNIGGLGSCLTPCGASPPRRAGSVWRCRTSLCWRAVFN